MNVWSRMELERISRDGDTVGLTPAGELVVRSERRDDGLTLWLSGELDRATSALLEHELEIAPAAIPGRRIVDLTGLEFIDSSGLDTLARAQRRARDNGHQLSFQGLRIIQRLLELSDTDRPNPRLPSGRTAPDDEHYYFARATASADVDHRRPPRDRLRGSP